MKNILKEVKNIYLVGIGGIGMSALALLLKDKGFNVRGSDICESYITDMLRKNGITVDIGHKIEDIGEDTQLLIYSSAIKGDNPQIRFAKDRNINILKRGELLGLLCEGSNTIAISGSHGKTTTTSLFTYILKSLDLDVTAFIGGLPLNYSKNAWLGNSYFVVETDESDGSFLFIKSWVSVITNIDYEHLDYYKDIKKLKESFLEFASNTKYKVFGCGDDLNTKEIIKLVDGISYGFGKENVVRADNFYFDGSFSCFDLIIEDKFINNIKIPLLGRHNVLNTLAVLGFLFYTNNDLEKAIYFLKDFKGTKRRCQIKERFNSVTFIDDYAHHPTEIHNTLEALRLLSPNRLFVIFQPHRFSRIKSLYKEFGKCFSYADELVITDIYPASEEPIEGVDVDLLLEEIKRNFFKPIHYIPKEELKQKIPELIKEKDFVVGLGAGDINILMDEIIDEFKKIGFKKGS